MKKQDKKPTSISDQIVNCVTNYIDSGNEKYKNAAIEKLEILAKLYHIPISIAPKSKAAQFDLYSTLTAFGVNKNGYIVTIPDLYNALNNYQI